MRLILFTGPAHSKPVLGPHGHVGWEVSGLSDPYTSHIPGNMFLKTPPPGTGPKGDQIGRVAGFCSQLKQYNKSALLYSRGGMSVSFERCDIYCSDETPKSSNLAVIIITSASKLP